MRNPRRGKGVNDFIGKVNYKMQPARVYKSIGASPESQLAPELLGEILNWYLHAFSRSAFIEVDAAAVHSCVERLSASTLSLTSERERRDAPQARGPQKLA